MAFPAPDDLIDVARDDEAADLFWEDVASLGVRQVARMADLRQFVATTPDGRYVRIPDPACCREQERVAALLVLAAHCNKWFN